MLNTDLKDVKVAVNKARNDLEEQAEHLNRCLAAKNGLDANQVEFYEHSNDFLEKLAKAKGISLEDLRDSIIKYKDKLDNLLSIKARDPVDSKESSLEHELSVCIEILSLATEVVCEC